MDNSTLTRKYTLAEYEEVLADPENRDRLLEEDTLDGGALLPDFQLPTNQIFAKISR